MAERPISPAELERLVERARAFAADLNDDALRHAFFSSAFNLDRLALKIVALADGASLASGSFQAPDEPLQPTPQGSEGLVERARAGLRNFSFGPGAGMVARLVDRIEALEGERDEAHAALKWTNQVYPSARDGGAWVSMTWREFNRMRRFVGLRELPSRAPKGERPSVNLGLRIALAEAEARADRAEAILSALAVGGEQ